MSFSKLHGYRNQIPSGLSPEHRELWDSVLRHVANLEDRLTAVVPAVSQGFADNPQGQGVMRVAKPVPCQFTVKVSAGVAYITITLPQHSVPPTATVLALTVANNANSGLVPMFHQLQSATSNKFDAGSNVKNYNPSAQVHFSFPDSNTVWRIRSSFDSKNFNDWSSPKVSP